MSERTRLHYPTVYVVHTEDKNRYKSVPDYTVYVGETKVAAARDHVENGLTKAEVMAMHGIASVTPLERWCREYRAGGPEALGPRPKGRPRGSKSKPRPEPTREQELAEQVAYLKAKVAYLEKLRALRASKSRDASEAPSPTARRAGTPARPPPEDSGTGQIHVLLSAVASGACDAGRSRAIGRRDLGTHAERMRPPTDTHVPGPRVRTEGVGQERARGHAAHGTEMRHPLQEPVEEVRLVQGRDGRSRA